MKKLISLLLAAALLILTATAAPEIKAQSAVLMDAATGEVLFEQNSHERLAPASVTKVMTLLLIFEALEDGRISMDDTVTASAEAASRGGSQIYLEEGEQMSMEDMIKSVVVASANDCAVALAEHLWGSEEVFVEHMNQRASELSMDDTHFVNCTGLDDDPEAKEHLTSAWDIAIMSRELLKHEAVKAYTTIWMDTVRDGTFGLSNTNRLIRFYSGATGLKTGYTSGAGFCLSASAERDGMELIAVVMKSATSTDRFESAKALLDYGFAGYALVTPQPSEPLPELPVELGTAGSVSLALGESPGILVEKGQSVDTYVELPEKIKAPVQAGETVGRLVATTQAGEEYTVDIVAKDTVERLTLLQIYGRLLRLAFFTRQPE